MAKEVFDTEEVMAEETAIVSQAAGGQIVSFTDNLMTDVSEQGYWASFPVVTMEDKKMLYTARHDNELLKDHMGEEIELAGIVLDTQVINDAMVGAKTVPCVHLIARDGKVYQSASRGVVTTACDIISDFGNPDTWGDEVVKVVCKETTTNAGNRYKYLAVL